MNKNTIGITSATINGLDNNIYYFSPKCYWAWDIFFTDAPYFTITNLNWICMGKTEDEAKACYKEYKKSFEDNYIHNGDRVPIIYDKQGIIAIGRSYHDCWIHVRDNFKVKRFKELNLDFKSLIVACNV